MDHRINLAGQGTGRLDGAPGRLEFPGQDRLEIGLGYPIREVIA